MWCGRASRRPRCDYSTEHLRKVREPLLLEVVADGLYAMDSAWLQQPMLAHQPLCTLAVDRRVQVARREARDHPAAVGRVLAGDLEHLEQNLALGCFLPRPATSLVT